MHKAAFRGALTVNIYFKDNSKMDNHLAGDGLTEMIEVEKAIKISDLEKFALKEAKSRYKDAIQVNILSINLVVD